MKRSRHRQYEEAEVSVRDWETLNAHVATKTCNEVGELVLYQLMITPKQYQWVGSVLRHLLRRLRKLDLSSVGMDDEACMVVCRGLEGGGVKLRLLALCGNSLGPASGNTIGHYAASLNGTALETLKLRFNKLLSVGAAAILKRVVNHPSLTFLDFGSNGITPHPALRDAVQALACSSNTIKALTLYGNDVTDQGLRQLSPYLTHPHVNHLTVLDLWTCGLGPDSGIVLSTIVQSCKTLQELKLGNNQLSDKGARRLCNGIVKSKSRRLVLLDLSANLLGDSSVEVLAEAVERSAIRTLNVRDNQMTLDGCLALINSCMATPNMRLINVARNHLTVTDCDMIYVAAHGCDTCSVTFAPFQSETQYNQRTYNPANTLQSLLSIISDQEVYVPLTPPREKDSSISDILVSPPTPEPTARRRTVRSPEQVIHEKVSLADILKTQQLHVPPCPPQQTHQFHHQYHHYEPQHQHQHHYQPQHHQYQQPHAVPQVHQTHTLPQHSIITPTYSDPQSQDSLDDSIARELGVHDVSEAHDLLPIHGQGGQGQGQADQSNDTIDAEIVQMSNLLGQNTSDTSEPISDLVALSREPEVSYRTRGNRQRTQQHASHPNVQDQHVEEQPEGDSRYQMPRQHEGVSPHAHHEPEYHRKDAVDVNQYSHQPHYAQQQHQHQHQHQQHQHQHQHQHQPHQHEQHHHQPQQHQHHQQQQQLQHHQQHQHQQQHQYQHQHGPHDHWYQRQHDEQHTHDHQHERQHSEHYEQHPQTHITQVQQMRSEGQSAGHGHQVDQVTADQNQHEGDEQEVGPQTDSQTASQYREDQHLHQHQHHQLHGVQQESYRVENQHCEDQDLDGYELFEHETHPTAATVDRDEYLPSQHDFPEPTHELTAQSKPVDTVPLGTHGHDFKESIQGSAPGSAPHSAPGSAHGQFDAPAIDDIIQAMEEEAGETDVRYSLSPEDLARVSPVVASPAGPPSLTSAERRISTPHVVSTPIPTPLLGSETSPDKQEHDFEVSEIGESDFTAEKRTPHTEDVFVHGEISLQAVELTAEPVRMIVDTTEQEEVPAGDSSAEIQHISLVDTDAGIDAQEEEQEEQEEHVDPVGSERAPSSGRVSSQVSPVAQQASSTARVTPTQVTPPPEVSPSLSQHLEPDAQPVSEPPVLSPEPDHIMSEPELEIAEPEAASQENASSEPSSRQEIQMEPEHASEPTTLGHSPEPELEPEPEPEPEPEEVPEHVPETTDHPSVGSEPEVQSLPLSAKHSDGRPPLDAKLLKEHTKRPEIQTSRRTSLYGSEASYCDTTDDEGHHEWLQYLSLPSPPSTHKGPKAVNINIRGLPRMRPQETAVETSVQPPPPPDVSLTSPSPLASPSGSRDGEKRVVAEKAVEPVEVPVEVEVEGGVVEEEDLPVGGLPACTLPSGKGLRVGCVKMCVVGLPVPKAAEEGALHRQLGKLRPVNTAKPPVARKPEMMLTAKQPVDGGEAATPEQVEEAKRAEEFTKHNRDLDLKLLAGAKEVMKKQKVAQVKGDREVIISGCVLKPKGTQKIKVVVEQKKYIVVKKKRMTKSKILYCIPTIFTNAPEKLVTTNGRDLYIWDVLAADPKAGWVHLQTASPEAASRAASKIISCHRNAINDRNKPSAAASQSSASPAASDT